MGRPVMLGNGSLTVGLNEQGLVNDFYYPYVGLDNLNTARSVHHLVGVWVDGNFSWVDDGNWQITVDFETDAMVSNVHMVNEGLQVELAFNDFVDHEYNAFCRQLTVTNKTDREREVRIFMHQVFQISRGGRADTALFVPDDDYILDYKGRCSLLIYGQNTEGKRYDQFSVGNYGIEGKEGTFKDAEDGELTGNAVEHGGVDSVIRFSCTIPATSHTTLDYWVIAADSQFSAQRIHHRFLKDGLTERLRGVRAYWKDWLGVAGQKLDDIDETYQPLVKKSLMVIKVHTDKRGGIIASCDSSIYNYGRDYYSYVWPRDGAYAMWPLIRLGYTHEPRRFFEFCRDILTPDGYLMHKYQPDRAIGSTWHPLVHGNHKELAIQEDETASVLYMLGEYLGHSQDKDFVFSLYSTFVQPAADFMAQYFDETTLLPHASYDLWEEKFLTHTYTVAIVYQALLVAADMAEIFEYPDDAVRWRDAAARLLDGIHALFDEERGAYRKGFLLTGDKSLQFDNTLDVSSLYGVMMYGLEPLKAERVQRTAAAIESILQDKSPIGGTPRYENDRYFGSDPAYLGNPWFVTTLWMAQYYIRVHEPDKARHYMQWACDRALPSGMLSEQVEPASGAPLSVTPLVWSHAEFINTALDLAQGEAQNASSSTRTASTAA